MSAEFDGLRAILGNTAVTVPVLDAPAVEEHAAVPPAATSFAPPQVAPPVEPVPVVALSASPAEVPLEEPAADPAVEAAAPTEDLDLQSTSHALADIPGLSDLDRGLERGDSHAHPDERDNASFDALGDGLDDTASGITARATDRSVGDAVPPLFAGAAARGRQPAEWPRQPNVPSSRKEPTDGEERRITGWALVAVMACCILLGATAAAAVFQDELSEIVASWGTPSTPHTVKAQ